MSRRTTISRTISAICFGASLAANAAHAQATAQPRHELTIAAGIARSDRIDRVVSPSVFGGTGYDALARLRTPFFGADLTASLTGGMRSLATSATATSREVLGEGALHLDLTQREAEHHSFARPVLGVAAQIGGTLTDHRYTTDDAAEKIFVFGLAAIGPTARWNADVGRGAAALQITAPLVGVVVHPYSAIRAGHPVFEPRAATLADVRAPRLTLSYTTAPRRGVALLTEYRADVMRYDGDLPIRGLSQSVVMGFTYRRGARR